VFRYAINYFMSDQEEECLSLSLVIPCRNEARRIPRTLDLLLQYLDQVPSSTNIEVLFSIEKSDDSTVNIVREKVGEDSRFSILEHGEARGKGFNVRQGILAARGECILFMDADLSVPLHFIGRFLEEFSKRPDLDVLIASRRHSESYVPIPQPLIRRLGGQTISWIVQALAVSPWPDTQCGFKAFRQAAARQIFSRAILDGFSFDLEVLALAEKMRMTIDEYPVEWNDISGSSVRPFAHGVAMIRDAIRIRSIIRDTLRRYPVI
jgi:dolichyl-phosphate beta-glucosyltransferase